MLRSVVLGTAIVILAACAFAAVAGAVGLWVPLIWCAIVVLGIAIERYRYKALRRDAPGAGWQRTNERFVDDETGKTVTVYIETQTGERQYVEE